MELVCTLMLLVFAVAAVALRPKRLAAPASSDSLDATTLAERYRPMLRLLDGSDFELLNDVGDPKLLRRMRTQRRAIFRGYLRNLRRDHASLCMQVRMIIVNSEIDRKDLATSLVRMESQFQWQMSAIQVRLALHYVGLGTVSVQPLINCFEQLRRQAEMLTCPMNAAQMAA